MTQRPAAATCSPDPAAAGRPIRVIVADDHPMFREGVARTLREHGIAVVGEAGDGRRALALIRAHHPDVAVVDLRMPEPDGLALAQRLRHHVPPVAVLVLSAFTNATLVHNALACGAAGYLAKDASREALVAAVRRVAAGGVAVGVPAEAGAGGGGAPPAAGRHREWPLP